MYAICFHRKGGPEALKVQEVPQPVPAAGEVLVRVRAAAVTPTELNWIPTWNQPNGEPRPFPIIPGHEFSGEVHALGTGVIDFTVGDEIYGLNDWFDSGAQAEFCRARAVDVALKPRSVDHALAAVTPISALTAWQGLIERAKLKAGERVLIHGAAGGVGLFAVQLARRCEARVAATASAKNLEFVRELGAEQVIDYQSQRFEELVRDFDVVFDTVGGETLSRSWNVLRPSGRLITIAASEETTQDERNKKAFFIVEPDRKQLESIANMIDLGELRPIVGASYPLAQAREAYENKPIRGKLVLTL